MEWLRETKWYGITKAYAPVNNDDNFIKGKNWYKGYVQHHQLNYREWLDEFIGKDIIPTKAHASAFFGVSRNLIRTRPIDYYKKILDDLAVHINPGSGFYLERSWHYIFNGHRHISWLIVILWLAVCFLVILLSLILSVFFSQPP
jgi:hypothetical protein